MERTSVASSSSTDGALGVADRASTAIVGRNRELQLVVAALAAGRHVLLEGPPGTGKSTLLRAVADASGLGFTFVEGNAELTPARLVGQFDPALVLAKGYKRKAFVDGPLATALRSGGLLYVEEINRVPEETLNVLVTVMSEGTLEIPRYGEIVAEPGFRLVAAMNPFDAVGTARISGAIYDRVCRVAMGYQDAADERAIVERAVAEIDGAPDLEWIERAVEAVRATRAHADLRVGSSVRGAIDAALVAAELARLRGIPPSDPTTGLDAALVALSGRVRVRDGCARTAEEVVEEIWKGAFRERGKASAPAGASRVD